MDEKCRVLEQISRVAILVTKVSGIYHVILTFLIPVAYLHIVHGAEPFLRS